MASNNTHYGYQKIGEMLQGARALYFLGIGGVSMSSLAQMSKDRGLRVGGFDRADSASTRALEAEGIPVFHEEDAAHLDGYDAVIYTVAIDSDHAEYQEALRRGLPLLSRADYLGYLMTAYKNRIGFSGSHGKSTATCMTSYILMQAAKDPTVLSGAPMEGLNGTFRRGSNDRNHLVFEACEYMDSFLDFYPSAAVILNVEMDHVDYFHSMEQLQASFAAYALRAGKDGCVIYNADDANTVLSLQGLPEERPRLVAFSKTNKNAPYFADEVNIHSGYASFILCCHEQRLPVSLSIPGEHNVYNALASLAAVIECGLQPQTAVQCLAGFGGAKRRMEYKGRLNGARVYDDYAHHPTEIAATLHDAGQLGNGRLLCVFQPHTFSRTTALFDAFVQAFEPADSVLVAPIYAAREKPDGVSTAARLAEEITRHWGKEATAPDTLEEIAAQLKERVAPGDTLVVMGAGNIDRLYPLLPLEK